MRRICRYLTLPLLLLCFVGLAGAQSGFDVNVGFGSAWDKSIGPIDINTLSTCTTSSTCSNTPSLSGFFLGFGANLMLWKHFGIGGEVNFQPARQNYLTFQQQSTNTFGDVLQSRTTFYDFNVIAQPLAAKRAALQLAGGVGGANVKFYENVSSSSAVLGNSQQSAFFGSSNHFQVHAGVGVQLYPTEHIFIRPQFDIHYVTNFSQFGRNVVPEATVWLGYSFGDRP